MHNLDVRSSFLNFITSLELLLTNKWEPQKGLIVERLALAIGKTVEERKEIFEDFERLYDIRSELLHQGKDEVSDIDLSLLSYIVFQAIVVLIPLTKNIIYFNDLIDKFNN